jgi:asparagine synthase (glutamine-hydrolysing)
LAKREGITVLLDGQGADEILGGYQKYMPWFLQQLLREKKYRLFLKEKKLLKANEFLTKWNIKNLAAAYFPSKAAKQLQQNARKAQNGSAFINRDFFQQYQNNDTFTKPVIKELDDILFYNTNTQGLQELLRYADRNSMAHSREVRLPFLDHRLVAFIFSLPAEMKIKDGFTKWILRKSVEPYLPTSIIWRRGKIGYEPPQQQWMEKPIAKELIMESRRKLVDNKVLTSQVMQSPIQFSSAHSAENADWKYISAAAIL